MDSSELNTITSKLNPEIVYKYNKKINKSDKNKTGTIETIRIGGKTLDITLGVAHPIFSSKGKLKTLVYYNIYLVDVKTMKVIKKIGLYEIPDGKLSDVYVDRELDISKLGKPLFFPNEFRELFPDMSYKNMHETEKEIPKEVNNNVDLSVIDKNITDGTLSVDGETDDDGRSDNADTDDDGMTESVDGETDDDGMTDDDEEELKEEVVHVETPDENAKIIESYKPNDDDNWIQKKFKNKNYEILPGNNDKSIFEAVKQAFDDDTTSTEQIRAVTSNTITIDEFLKYKNIYDNLITEKENVNKKIQENLETQQKIDPSMDRNEQLVIASNEDKRKKEYSKLNKEYNMLKGHLSHYSFMENVTNIEDLRRAILTNAYWGDNIAISLVEKLLYEDRLKIIVLLEDKSREGDLAKIVNCNNYNAIELNYQQIVRPKNYVILSLSKKNYNVVTYKGKKMMTYDEIPYGIKRRITDNCTNVL